MRILAICAHVDDVVYGCAGTLLQHSNDERLILALTDFQEQGARAVAASLGVDIEFLGGHYNRLGEVDGTWRTQLLSRIRDFEPDYIFAPPESGDYKPDHIAAGRASLEAATHSGVIGAHGTRFLRYFIPASTYSFQPNLWVSLPEEWLERKAQMARLIVAGAGEVWPERLLEWELGTGLRFAQEVSWPCLHAEAFDAVWRVPFTRLPERDASLDGLSAKHMQLFRDLESGVDLSAEARPA
jgi:LmbE family N-acetylglucosaminyl deacetylase